MFNDILNGKDTLEKEPVETSPYRPDPSSSDLVCSACGRTFPGIQAVAGRCRACAPTVDAALDAMRGPKADYTDHGGNERKRDFGLSLIVVCVVGAAIVGIKLYLRWAIH